MARSAADIQADLDVAYAARREAMKVAAYSHGSANGASRSAQRQSLKDLNETIKDLESQLATATNGGIRVRGITPA
jgi:bacterioferritin (cytochrome b1)